MTKDDYCKVFGKEMALAGARDFSENPSDWYHKWHNMATNYVKMTRHQLALSGKHWGGKRASRALARNKDWSP